MGWFGDDSSQCQQYNDYNNIPDGEHKASLTHEIIAGAAAYEADKAYNRHVEENGQPASHDEAKELLSGFAGAFIDREAETKGLDFIDRERAKRDASQQAYDGYNSQF